METPELFADNEWLIDPEYKVKGENLCVALYKKPPKAKSWVVCGYYNSVGGALRKYCREKLNTNCGSAEDLLDEIDALYDMLDEVADMLKEYIYKTEE